MGEAAEEIPVLNPADAERWIRQVKDEIAKGVRIVTNTEMEAKSKKRAFDLAWAYAIKRSEGPEYLRKADATIATMSHREESDNAAIALGHAERRAKALDKELFAAMAINSNIRSMWTAAGVAE
jgi:hypothetical protein